MLAINTHQIVFLANTGLIIVSAKNSLLLKTCIYDSNKKNAPKGLPDLD